MKKLIITTIIVLTIALNTSSCITTKQLRMQEQVEEALFGAANIIWVMKNML